jgi:SAM-dependent methyltransferase
MTEPSPRGRRAAAVQRLRVLARRIVPATIIRLLRTRWHRVFWPWVGHVDFGDLRRLEPVSRGFGYDRGLPIDRYYIERFLALHHEDVRGRVLEFGDNAYTRRFGADNVTVSDVLDISPKNRSATFVDDLAQGTTLPAEAFDCIIATQTLQFVYDLAAAVRTLERILKPGGVLLLTCPGISQIDDPAWNTSWHWMFTSRSVARLLEEVFPAENITVAAQGNVLAATAFLHGLATDELHAAELAHRDAPYEVVITARAVKPERPAAS